MLGWWKAIGEVVERNFLPPFVIEPAFTQPS